MVRSATFYPAKIVQKISLSVQDALLWALNIAQKHAKRRLGERKVVFILPVINESAVEKRFMQIAKPDTDSKK